MFVSGQSLCIADWCIKLRVRVFQEGSLAVCIINPKMCISRIHIQKKCSFSREEIQIGKKVGPHA